MADRLATYKNTPGLFADSPKATPPPVADPTPAAAPALTPEQELDKVLKDDSFPADLKSEGSKANWKALRAKAKERNEYEAKWREAQSKLEAIEKAPKPSAIDPAEFENTKKERDQYSEQLRVSKIENHPKFKAYFEGKASELQAEAKSIGGAEYGDKLASLLKQPESEYRNAQIEDVFSKISPVKQIQLGSLLRESEKLGREREAEITKARADYDRIMGLEREQQESVFKQQRAQLDSEIAAELADAQKHLPIFQKLNGDAKQNEQVENLINSVKNAFNGTPTAKDLARAAVWAHSAPILLQDSLAKAREIDSLKAELASLRAAKPKPGAGESPSVTSSGMPDYKNPVDRILWQAQNVGAVR